MNLVRNATTHASPVLHARKASLSCAQLGTVRDCSFLLSPGDLALVRAPDTRVSGLLADGACGLVTITAGTVSFLGRDWRQPAIQEASSLRGRIGRVFGGTNWLGYLPVSEAMILSHLYHRSGTRSGLSRQALALCQEFGLPGVPADRPGALSKVDLMRAACARAFLGEPRLVVLEDPMRDLPQETLGPLAGACRRLRDAGGAVLWFTKQPGVWSSSMPDATHRFQALGGRLSRVEEP